jgi:leucyl aminopeptidase
MALAEGAELSRYAPDPYRTVDRRDTRLRELRVSGAPEEALREGSIRGRAKNLARELVNEPANMLDPPELARRAEAVAEVTGLRCTVLDAGEMESLGMGAILTVSRGSETPPAFIVLRHEPRQEGPLLALVGKAVTFDTGGISIKPSADMGRMKGDMAGGAAVIGALQAIAELGVPVNVVGLVPAVVNMPDGRAWKPGDVVTTMAGKTVETITTDAEGRMLLADAVCYARKLGATHVVDIATLTGACVIALGHVASGLYGTPELVEAVRASGEEAGERHWPMPLFPEYRELIRSEIADLKNSGGRGAGSVTAAWFIKEFAGDTPWAHLDIAGSSQYDKPKPWAPAGPTGTGVGTFVNLARRLASE